MLDFLNSFKSLLKLVSIRMDNVAFRAHYRFTVVMLIVFSIMVTSKQYFGDPIQCDVNDISKKGVIEAYCWMHGTYVIKKTLTDDVLPGLGNEFERPRAYTYNNPYNKNPVTISPWMNTLREKALDENIITQKYYQWVCVLLGFQALVFYVPWYLWKHWEGGRLRMLIKDLGGPIIPLTWNQETKDKMTKYFTSKRYDHNLYALKFAICEVLNFINVIIQILITDRFLNGRFASFNVGIATFQGHNPMSEVFPKLTKCNYYKYGPSGSIIKLDALCVLPLNVVNERLFVILWFWFYFLLVLSFGALVYRAVEIGVPLFRAKRLRWHTDLGLRNATDLVRHLSFGDYFLLNELRKNLNSSVFKDIVEDLTNVLCEKCD